MKNDVRTRYTQKVITDAFLELLKEKPMNKVTVKEICDKAQINRSTFYKYYKDCYDLLDQLEERAITDLEARIRDVKKSGMKNVLVPVLKALRSLQPLFLSVQANGQSAEISNVSRSFLWRLMARCFRAIPMPTVRDKEMQKQVYAFLSGGCNNMVEYWIYSGMKEEPEVLAQQIELFCNSLLAGLRSNQT